MSRSADSLAREHTEKAITTIREVMEDPFAENRDRLAAAKEILNRGHGMPAQAIIAVPGNQQLQRQLAAMTDDELMAVVHQARLPRLNELRTVTSTAEDITPVSSEADPLLA